MMKPKDFEKFRMKAPEPTPLASNLSTPAIFGTDYGMDTKSLLETFPPEDRPTVEEAQRLRDEFAKNFPTLEEKLQELRAQAFQAQGS